MARMETRIGELGDLITRGLQNDLEKIIKEKLKQNVDGILSELAREIAKHTLVRAESIMTMDGGFGPSAKVVLMFNNKDVQYLADPKLVDLGDGKFKVDDGLGTYRNQGGGSGG